MKTGLVWMELGPHWCTHLHHQTSDTHIISALRWAFAGNETVWMAQRLIFIWFSQVLLKRDSEFQVTSQHFSLVLLLFLIYTCESARSGLVFFDVGHITYMWMYTTKKLNRERTTWTAIKQSKTFTLGANQESEQKNERVQRKRDRKRTVWIFSSENLISSTSRINSRRLTFFSVCLAFCCLCFVCLSVRPLHSLRTHPT